MWPIWVSYCFHCFLMSEPTIQLRTKFRTFLIDINIFDPGKPKLPKKMGLFLYFFICKLWNELSVETNITFLVSVGGSVVVWHRHNEYHLSRYHHHHHGQNRLTYTFAARDDSQRTAGAAVRFWEASAKFDFPTKTRKSRFLSSDSEIIQLSFSCDGNFHLLWHGIVMLVTYFASAYVRIEIHFLPELPSLAKSDFTLIYTSSSLTGYQHLCGKRQRSQQI